MGRLEGSLNITDYKYTVKRLINNEWTNPQYFITQQEIQNEFNLKRTAVYYLINNKDKIKKLKNNYEIIKLDIPLPVYKCVQHASEGDERIIYEYTKHKY